MKGDIYCIPFNIANSSQSIKITKPSMFLTLFGNGFTQAFGGNSGVISIQFINSDNVVEKSLFHKSNTNNDESYDLHELVSNLDLKYYILLPNDSIYLTATQISGASARMTGKIILMEL